ncbi:MAG: DUF3108 domain-containing protein [Ignavibacteria bacterium]
MGTTCVFEMMGMKKISLFLLLFCFSNSVLPQAKILVKGEELKYIVYYGFIKLGEVNMKVTGAKTEGSNVIYTAWSEMKSYQGIPFVTLNSIFETEIVFDGKDLYSRNFKATDYKDDGLINTEYKFNYDSSYVHVIKINNGKIEKNEKINFNHNIKFQDGLSLFYRARINSFSTDDFLIPVFMNESETSVNYYFSSLREEISIPMKDDIKSIRCNGVANFEGVFGLSGEFGGWFSDDEARMPLKALVNVMLGNVTLELDSYTRPGWKPGK